MNWYQNRTCDSFHTAASSGHAQTCRHATFTLSDWELCLKLSFKQQSQDPTHPSIKIHLFFQFLNRRKKSSKETSIINKYSMAIYFRVIFFSFLLKRTLTVPNFSPSDSFPVSPMPPPQEPGLLGFVSKRKEVLHFYEASRGLSFKIV